MANQNPVTPIKRALISVSDKSGIVAFAEQLVAQGVEILSTGGTFKLLTESNVKATEVSDYSVPSNITTFRSAVRTKSNEMETAIDNASDAAALETLYTYTEQEDGSVTRPLGQFPTLED